MSKRSSVQDFMAKSSLFKNEKYKMHSSYITHEQYFSEIKDQKVNHSHFLYLNSSPIGKLNPDSKQSLPQNSVDLRLKSSAAQQKYSQIYPYQKLQVYKIQQNSQIQKQSLVQSVEKRIKDLQEKQQYKLQSPKRELQPQTQKKKKQNNNLNQDEIIQGDQEHNLAKTTSQNIQDLNLSPSRKFSSPDYDYHTIDIVISPNPKLKSDRFQKQITDNFAQTYTQMQQPVRISSREIKQNNQQIYNVRPQTNNLQPRKNRSFNYNQMQIVQTNKKQQALRNSLNKANIRRKYYDQIIEESRMQSIRGNHRMQDPSRKLIFFSATQREAQNYVSSIQLKLKEATLSLSKIQTQIDNLIFHNLDVECQKIRTLLTYAIQNSLNRYKEAQKRRLQNSKMEFIAELYEIQSSIELRRQEVQKLKFSFEKQNHWKRAVSELLTNNFEQNVDFLISKSHQIESQWLGNTNQFISRYNHLIQQNAQKGIKKYIQNIIETIFTEFTSKKEENSQKKYKSQFQIEGIRHKTLD